MSNHLRKVERAERRRAEICARASADYLEAIRAARTAGHTLEEIGHVLGITKQGVRYLLHPDPRRKP